jgi:hypothetical protein
MILRDEGFAQGVHAHVDGLGCAVRTQNWGVHSDAPNMFLIIISLKSV